MHQKSKSLENLSRYQNEKPMETGKARRNTRFSWLGDSPEKQGGIFLFDPEVGHEIIHSVSSHQSI